MEQFTLDRTAEEAAGTFGQKILQTRPDAVIDLTCYTLESAQPLVEALQGKISHFLHCGTIWVHGRSVEVPIREEDAREPFGDYGCRKAAIEEYLLKQARSGGFPATILHPGHLVGPGWMPITAAGNFNAEVFSQLARGKEVTLPNNGMETLLHVHADDVAQGFVKALNNWSAAVGESFHIVSPAAITLNGCAKAVAGWFGAPHNLRFQTLGRMEAKRHGKRSAHYLGHIARSSNCSIDKAALVRLSA